MTFEDPDGYRVVLYNAAWHSSPHVAAAQQGDSRPAEELIAAYASGTALLRDAVARMTDDRMRLRPPRAGGALWRWSVTSPTASSSLPTA